MDAKDEIMGMVIIQGVSWIKGSSVYSPVAYGENRDRVEQSTKLF